MAWIIDYDTVVERLEADGLKCHYYNGGAFGFRREITSEIRGWIGPDDQTIKPGARSFVRRVKEPYEPTLTNMLKEAWHRYLPGVVWIMPVSHWAYELNHGNKEWLPTLIENLELDPGHLVNRNNAAAIEFSEAESPAFERLSERLLEMLMGSDFMIAFPRRKTICTLHHHKQLWWVSADHKIICGLDALLTEFVQPSSGNDIS